MTDPALDQLEAAVKHFRMTQTPEFTEAMQNFIKALSDAAEKGVPMEELQKALGMPPEAVCPPEEIGGVVVKKGNDGQYYAELHVPVRHYNVQQLCTLVEALSECLYLMIEHGPVKPDGWDDPDDGVPVA
jgi:hypothetical protein